MSKLGVHVSVDNRRGFGKFPQKYADAGSPVPADWGTDGGGTLSTASLPCGAMIDWPSAIIPQGWLARDGSAVSRTTYADLFAVIGTLYGAGDGVDTFNLPNDTDRVSVGAGGAYAIGETFGEATHTLTEDEMPKHDHELLQYSDNGATPFVSVGLASSTPATSWFTEKTGGNAAHNNIQPSITHTKIIKYTNADLADLIFDDSEDSADVGLTADPGDDGYAARRDHVHAIASHAVTLTKLATQEAETILANATGSVAAPAAVAVAEQTLVGRVTSGHVTALTVSEVKTLLGAMTPAAHNLLAVSHGDTAADSVVRGDIIAAQGALPVWARLAKGSQYSVLTMGPDEPAWSTGALNIASGKTLTVSETGTAALGAGTLTAATMNDVTGATHTHAITASSDVSAGTTDLLKSAGGALKLRALDTAGHMKYTTANDYVVVMDKNGDDNIVSQTPTKWAGTDELARFRLTRKAPDVSWGGRHFQIIPYEYGMAIDYPGVVECWVATWSIHNKLIGGMSGGANLFVGDDLDWGGIHATARALNSGSTLYCDIISEKFDTTSHGPIYFTVRNPTDSFIFRTGAAGAEVPHVSILGDYHLYVTSAGTTSVLFNTSDPTSSSHFELAAPSSLVAFYSLGSSFSTSGRFIAAGGLLDSNGVGGLSIAAINGPIKFWTGENNLRATIDGSGIVLTGGTLTLDTGFSVSPVLGFLVANGPSGVVLRTSGYNSLVATYASTRAGDDNATKLGTPSVKWSELWVTGLTVKGSRVGAGTIMSEAGVTYERLNVNGSQLYLGTSSMHTEESLFQIAPALGGAGTHANFTSVTIFKAGSSGGLLEAMRFGNNKTAAMIGFLGAAAVARPAALTAQLTTIRHTAPGTQDYAIQDLIDSSVKACFGFATKDEGNSVLAVIANLQTRLGELENKLGHTAGLGLITHFPRYNDRADESMAIRLPTPAI